MTRKHRDLKNLFTSIYSVKQADQYSLKILRGNLVREKRDSMMQNGKVFVYAFHPR